MMKTRDITVSAGLLLCGMLLFTGGCYTVLWAPGSTGESGYTSEGAASPHDGSYELNYSDNCLSCHSQAELDDRSYDMQKVGMVSAHGIAIDRYGWQSPSTVVPWWYNELPPAPPTAVSSSTPVPSGNNEPKKRTVGESRGGDAAPTGDTGTQASAPVPTGASTPAAPTPPPAAAVAKDSPPSGGDQNTNGRTRTSGTTTTTTNPPATSVRKPE